MITVQVWDRGVVKAVDKAIREAGLGLNPQTEGQMIRVPIPDLNEERRRELTRVAAKYAEEARVAVRKVRQRRHRGAAPARKGRRDLAGRAAQAAERHPAPDRRPHQADRRDAGAEGQGNPAGLMSSPPPRRVRCRGTSRSSWTATAAGRRPAACRASPATGAAPRRSAAPSTAAGELGIPYLTLFGFSSENWKRPLDEVDDLMGLLRHYLRGEIAELHKNGVRLRVIGDRARLSADIVALIDNAEALTRDNARRQPDDRLSYGGRAEIVAAARAIAAKVGGRRASRRDAIDETLIARPPVHRRPARPRSADPHQRRAAHQQFPAVAVRLCRAGLHQDAVAGFRARRSRTGDRRFRRPRAPLRGLRWLALKALRKLAAAAHPVGAGAGAGRRSPPSGSAGRGCRSSPRSPAR